MTTLRGLRLAVAAIAAVLLAAPAADAAFITIDDSDPDTITITAGDFEFGFSVNGVLLTSGLGDSGSITLPDTGHSFEGSWIDIGATPPGAEVEVLFALPGNPTGVTSGTSFTAETDGFVGTLFGGFGGFNGSVYFTDFPTFPQDGSTVPFGLPFLSGTFTSEAAQVVPEPASLTMLALGAVGGVVGLRRRRAVAAA